MHKEEILPLNLLRFLAALSVLFVHKFGLFIEKGYLPKGLGVFNHFAGHGYLGVNLFFLISGFVITLSCEGRTFGQFVSARFIRLFPVFWICVSVTTLFTLFLSRSADISLPQYFANLTMIPKSFGDYLFIDGSYWTLVVELHFYFFVAVVLLLRRFVFISLEKFALMMTIPLLYDALFFNPYSASFVNSLIGHIFHEYSSEYAQYFLAGILFYATYKHGKNFYRIGALIICYVVAVLKALDMAHVSNSPTIVMLHITAFFGVFLLISLKEINNDSFLFLGKQYKKILITLGAITYPLYLLHNAAGDLS